MKSKENATYGGIYGYKNPLANVSSNDYEFLSMTQKEANALVDKILTNKNKVHHLQKGHETVKQNFIDECSKKTNKELFDILFKEPYTPDDEENISHIKTLNDFDAKEFLMQMVKNKISILTCDARSELMIQNIENSGHDTVVAICGLRHYDYMKKSLLENGDLIGCVTFNNNKKCNEENVNTKELHTAQEIVKNQMILFKQFTNKDNCCTIM